MCYVESPTGSYLMTSRYISTSERSNALAQGVAIYGHFMNMGSRSLGVDEASYQWEAWKTLWGPEMTQIVRKTSMDLFDAACNF